MSCLPDSPRPTPSRRRSRFPAASRCICAWRWISSGSISPTAWSGEDWRWLPQQFDASILSDEAGPPAPRISPAHSSAWLPGHGGRAPAGGFRLFRIPRTRVPRESVRIAMWGQPFRVAPGQSPAAAKVASAPQDRTGHMSGLNLQAIESKVSHGSTAVK